MQSHEKMQRAPEMHFKIAQYGFDEAYTYLHFNLEMN